MSTTVIDPNPNPNPHILIFPYPAQGHMLPLLDLTHKLSSLSYNNLLITILITPKNLQFLSPLLSSNPNITPLVLPFPPNPSIPPGVENVKDLGNKGNLPMITTLFQLREPIIHWFNSHPNPPVSIISDFFLGWTTDLAKQLDIPRFSFYTSGAFLTSVFDYCWNHVQEVKSSDSFEFSDLPGSPVFKQEHLPSAFRSYNGSNPDLEFVKDGMIANILSYGCIFNSFEDLEGEYFGYLKKITGHDRVYGVGPINLLGLTSPTQTEASLPVQVTGTGLDSHVMNWLDGCPDESVVYVCFGSQKQLSEDQTSALASALEKSMTRFVWVVKTGKTRDGEGKNTCASGSLLGGFEERVSGRGLVIINGWAPQKLILSHRAVGGFLSHCGWNSLVEVIISRGVMTLAWPMEADQFINARLLVEELGVGVRVCEGADTVPDSDELGGVIGEVMSESWRVKLKGKSLELKCKALEAVKDGGSSARDLDRLMKELNQFRIRT